MSRRIVAGRHYMGGYPTIETALVEVRDGKATFAFDDGDRVQFDAQELTGEVEAQLLAQRRQEAA